MFCFVFFYKKNVTPLKVKVGSPDIKTAHKNKNQLGNSVLVKIRATARMAAHQGVTTKDWIYSNGDMTESSFLFLFVFVLLFFLILHIMPSSGHSK